MPPGLSHSRRTQSLLMMSKLLDCRDNASPFTLIIDSLEQPAKPLLREHCRRAKHSSKLKVIFISFETLRAPLNVDHFIPAHSMSPSQLLQELKPFLHDQMTKHLLIIDTLQPLLTIPHISVPTYLSNLLTPTTCLLAIHHSNLPLPPQTGLSHSPYSPNPLRLLRYLATTVLTTHSLQHLLQAKAAQERSVAAPVFGIEEDEEGILQGLDYGFGKREGKDDNEKGFVVECEMRRKSGRGIGLWFFLGPSTTSSFTKPRPTTTTKSEIILLEDHPLYRVRRAETDISAGAGEDELGAVSFNLGLTEKQRRDREGVVLPHFDAQRADGGGEGGRILYDMSVEDDFDEEEDEI